MTKDRNSQSSMSEKNGHATRTKSDSINDTDAEQEDKMDFTFVGKKGGEIFHELMIQHQVKHIFGYPGGAILPVFDALHASSFIDIIVPRHEQGAGHMAEGYAKATGRPAVILVTSGPGATNIITALADAFADGVPIIAFTGQVALSAQGTQAFQEVDIVSMTRTCTKWQTMVKDVADLPRSINEAFDTAMSGRPGPVLVDLPTNVTSSVLKDPIPIQRLHLPAMPDPNHDDIGPLIHQAAAMINAAHRPVIFAGQGVNNHPDGPAVLTRLAHQGNIPVTTTVHGMGAFDEKDPLALEMLGMHGSAIANLAMQHADVIIAIGARFDDRATMNVKGFAPEAVKAARQKRGGIIHFEIDPNNIDLTVKSTLAIVGDATENVRRLIDPIDWNDRRDWLDMIQGWKHQYPFYFEPAPEDAPLKPQQLLQELERQTAEIKDRLTITTGVGSHQMWAAQLLSWRAPRSMITSGSLGTMGFGLPSAIGVKLARPDHTVMDIDGDSSFAMTAMELATAAQFNIGIKVMIFNNSFQAMVGQFQDMHYGKRHTAVEVVNPEYIDFGKALRVKAIRVTKTSELPEKIAEFLAHNGPVLMDAMVDKHEYLYPIVHPGHSLDQFLVHPALSKQ